MKDNEIKKSLFKYVKDMHAMENDPRSAKLTIHGNKVISGNSVKGLTVESDEKEQGVDIKLELADNTKIEKPVLLCFGVIPENGIQKINLDVVIGKNSEISLKAHCVFPNAVDVQHIMNAEITLRDNAKYKYFERHIHSPEGGINVIPKAAINIGKNAVFSTEFELIEGRVGNMDIEYITYVDDYGTADMSARVAGSENDKLKISETSFLKGKYSKAALTTKIAVRDKAKADVYNKIVAEGDYSRGHVDCKEIIKDIAEANAVPIVGVKNSTAHVTHEASIGSVDKKQLETLMARGLSEENASDLIIRGMLSQT
ncbi:MAG: SufD family Fe-S cluster assembly protein [Victivallales bacterium]|nr:SufD family Fe-S cluster assembly protein [Victivallales bacterium]MCF7888480.1 SufD family Fe-S cluster assembly protein [Victivallales bacterium]